MTIIIEICSYASNYLQYSHHMSNIDNLLSLLNEEPQAKQTNVRLRIKEKNITTVYTLYIGILF